MITLDLRQIMIATLWKKYEAKINNKKTKDAIKNGDVEYKFADYGKVILDKTTKTKYFKDGKEIEIKTAEIIKKYCEDNGISIVKEEIKNHSVEFVPSQKAINEFNKMLLELENSQHKNIAKIAGNILETE